jgi:hypothetical protein
MACGSRSLRKVLLEEMGMSEAIVRDGHEVIPRFRIFTADGDFVVLMPLSDNAAERQRRIRLVGLFMAWKMATGFVISGESHAPDAISSFFVGRHEREGLFRPIEHGPPDFVWRDSCTGGRRSRSSIDRPAASA